jgi:DNA modification methylase
MLERSHRSKKMNLATHKFINLRHKSRAAVMFSGALLADLAPECLMDEEAVPETPVLAVTVPGDLWVLGRSLVLCGDALLSGSMQGVLKCQPADMVFSDPPYNVAYTQKSGRHPGGLRTIANDNLGPQFEKFLDAVCVQMLSVTRGAVYLYMSSSEFATLQRAFTAAGGHWSTFIIWSKDLSPSVVRITRERTKKFYMGGKKAKRISGVEQGIKAMCGILRSPRAIGYTRQ